MATIFKTLGDLVTTVISFLNKETDVDLPAVVPTWVALAEAVIRRRQRWYTQLYSLTNSGNPLAITAKPQELPDHVNMIESLWSTSDLTKGNIEIVTPDVWRRFIAVNADVQGRPIKAILVPQMDSWNVDPDDTGPSVRHGPNIFFWPTPPLDGSFTVDFQYIRDPDPLTNSTVNGLYIRHPDLYLYGALVESAPFLEHDERLPMWKARFDQAIDEINLEREHAQYSGTDKTTALPYTIG